LGRIILQGFRAQTSQPERQMAEKGSFHGRRNWLTGSFRWTGREESRTRSTAMAFGFHRRAGLDMRAFPALGSVWRHRCGRCRPPCVRGFLLPHPP
jgi:hypothetical protein